MAAFRSLNLVLLGPPASGRGTQAKLLSERYDVPHISSGDLLAEEVRQGTDAGLEAAAAMERGELVPGHLLRGMILQQLHHDGCARGFMLDGYPRTVEQAGMLDDMLAELGRTIERVILLDVPDEVILRRLAGRQIHAESGRIYHLESNPPACDGLDDLTGEPLVILPDDHDDVVRERLHIFHTQTEPLVDFYRARGLLVRVDGSGDREQVTSELLHAVGAPVVV